MRVLLQRVTRANVSVDGVTIGEIGQGLLLLAGFGSADDESVLIPMANKLANLRVFADDDGRFQYSLLDTGFSALAVPQFTLFGRTAKGRRPDFTAALEPAKATLLFDGFVLALNEAGIGGVQTGRFGADMQVSLVNDGPVTLMLED